METAETGWEKIVRIMKLRIARVVFQFYGTFEMFATGIPEGDMQPVQLAHATSQAYEVSRLGINPDELQQRIAARAHTGYPAVRKGSCHSISLTRILEQLNRLNFHLVDTHWCERLRGSLKVYATFSPVGEEKDLEPLTEFFETTWNGLVIFANPIPVEGNKVIRADSILLFGPDPFSLPAWQLELDSPGWRKYVLKEKSP